jgi:DNA-binding IclR family transcriptional regulator
LKKKKLAAPNRSLEKAFNVIEILAAGSEPMRLTDIAKQAEMPTSTVMRLLNTLHNMGYVQQSDKTLRYSLSRKFAGLCDTTREKTDIVTMAHPLLERLCADVEECVCLDTELDNQSVNLDKVEPPGSDILAACVRIGKRAPLYCSAPGKFFLASNYTVEALGRYMRRYASERFTANTILSISEMQIELNRCERHGYALDNEECEIGFSSMAVGIRDFTGHVIAAVSIVAPVERLSATRVHQLYSIVQDTAEEISKRMGYRGEFPRGEFNFD